MAFSEEDGRHHGSCPCVRRPDGAERTIWLRREEIGDDPPPGRKGGGFIETALEDRSRIGPRGVARGGLIRKGEDVPGQTCAVTHGYGGTAVRLGDDAADLAV